VTLLNKDVHRPKVNPIEQIRMKNWKRSSKKSATLGSAFDSP